MSQASPKALTAFDGPTGRPWIVASFAKAQARPIVASAKFGLLAAAQQLMNAKAAANSRAMAASALQAFEE